MSKTLLILSLLASLTSFTQESTWRHQMRDASRRAAAKTNLIYCSIHSAPRSFWSCKATLVKAIRAGLDLDEITSLLVLKAIMAPEGVVFDLNKLNQETLALDISTLIDDLGTISETNIEKVSEQIVTEAKILAERHYRYY